ncbi:MAG: hypothetical protein LBR64_09515 [Dysgonamonadaceae bacterium]|nr:hypothetical protein [Dysgonamonadaceae bacterium]
MFISFIRMLLGYYKIIIIANGKDSIVHYYTHFLLNGHIIFSINSYQIIAIDKLFLIIATS